MRARLLTVTLVAVLVAPATAFASPTATLNDGTTGKTRTVDLALTLPAPHAVPRGATGSLRAAALAALTPSAASRTAVVAAAGALGLTADSGGTTTLAVHGPAALVRKLFPARDSNGALAVPPALAGYVSAALDPAVARPLFHGFDTGSHQVTGPQLNTAYGVTPLPAATIPVLTAQTGIVATLQLSGWSNSDLTAYSPYVYGSGTGYDPVASGQYTAVSVDGRGEALTGSDGNGDGEVALDQETLLATAPQLKQRAYFAPNSAAGVTDTLARVLADVQAGLPIVSFSISYGGCESDIDAQTAAAMNAGFAQLQAAGVTVFAASGDSGRYCTSSGAGGLPGGATTTTQPTFPASAPAVIGVGGTRHENGGGPALPDTAWDEGGTGVNAQGSGGGTSTLFVRPGFQSGLAPSGAGGSGRLVPDIATDGDPATGIVTINRGAMVLTGGTSLSSPLAAAQLADLVAARAPGGFAPTGVGDLHGLLYANPAALTDVVRIQDGATTPADQPTTTGYDLATGLGTPNWAALAVLLFTSAAPGIAVPVTSTTAAVPVTVSPAGGVAAVQVFATVDGDNGCNGTPLGLGTVAVTVPQGTHTITVYTLSRTGQCSSPATAQVTVDSVAPVAQVTSFRQIGVTSQILSLAWSGNDPAPGSGIASYLVTVAHKGGATPDLAVRVPGSTLSMTTPVTGGADEVLSVTPTDAFGNVGVTGRSAPLDVPVDDRAARTSKGWSRARMAHTLSGTVTTTSRLGATAAITLRGSIVGILATTSPKGGKVQLFVDGKVRRTISLRSTTTRYRQSFTVTTADASHNIVVRSLGGGVVILDGLVIG